MTDLRLEELSAENIVGANSLTLKRGQEQFVAPATYAAAAAVTNPATTWQRVVIADDKVVGFIQGNFDKEAPTDLFRCSIWRINVDADFQGTGVGRFAVNQLLEEARRRGFDRITVIWDNALEGPGGFFQKVGFAPIGETDFGETIGELKL